MGRLHGRNRLGRPRGQHPLPLRRRASPPVARRDGAGRTALVGPGLRRDPDTAVQRDVLRGTGGSVYFLRRQDITAGSVSLTVQTIDPDTGRVVSSRALTEGVDFRVDHIQGVLILTGPLASAVSDGDLVTDGSGAFDQTLVAQYE